MVRSNFHARKWSSEEEDKFSKLWDAKMPPQEIAEQMDRTVAAIHSRRFLLKLKPRDQYERKYSFTNPTKPPLCETCKATLTAVATCHLEGNKCFREECPFGEVFSP